MKKLLLIAITLTTSVGLVACGNEDSSTKKPKQDVKTEQHKSNKTKSKKDSKDTVVNKSTDNDGESLNSNKDKTTSSQSSNEKDNSGNTAKTSDNSTQSQDTQTAQQPTRSQKDETNGRGDVVNSGSQAITTLSNGLGNNSDFAYTLLSTENHMYEIQVTSKSIRAQGGTGTVGIYDVMEDGTYFLRP